MFNNVPGDADDPTYRNPRLTGNVHYEIDFRAAVSHNITVVIWSEYENIYEIDQWGGILYYSIHTEIFAPKINEINFIPVRDCWLLISRTVFVTSEKYRPTNHRSRTALCH